MQIHCESCGAAIPGANINIHDKLAVCSDCGTVFSFADHVQQPTRPRKIKPPKALAITETRNTLDISFRWREILKAEEYGFAALCAIGVVGLGSLAYAMFNGMDTLPEAALGAAAVLGVLACLYMVLMILFNQVHITVDDFTIHTHHAPLPLKNERIQRAEIVQVDSERASYNNDNPDSEFVDYNVRVLCRDGRKVTLTTLRRDLARYLAHVIDDYLEGEGLPSGSVEDEDGEDSLPLADELKADAASSGQTRRAQD